jgi:hypothetical protein
MPLSPDFPGQRLPPPPRRATTAWYLGNLNAWKRHEERPVSGQSVRSEAEADSVPVFEPVTLSFDNTAVPGDPGVVEFPAGHLWAVHVRVNWFGVDSEFEYPEGYHPHFYGEVSADSVRDSRVISGHPDSITTYDLNGYATGTRSYRCISYPPVGYPTVQSATLVISAVWVRAAGPGEEF